MCDPSVSSLLPAVVREHFMAVLAFHLGSSEAINLLCVFFIILKQILHVKLRLAKGSGLAPDDLKVTVLCL